MLASALFQKNEPSKQALLAVFFFAASLVGCFIFACAAPFAAIATAAAATLSKRLAFLLVFLVWAANQTIGYGFLHYPQNAESYLWGLAIAIGAFSSLFSAQLLMKHSSKTSSGWGKFAGVFVVSFIAYELTLFAAALTPLGGLSGFTADVIWAVFLSNVMGLFIAAVIIYIAEIYSVFSANPSPQYIKS